MMNKKINWHIIGVILFVAYHGMEVFIGNTTQQMLMLSISYVSISIITFYGCYFLIWKPFLLQPKVLRLVIGLAIGFSFFIGLRFLIEETLYPVFFGFDNYKIDEFWYYVKSNYWYALFFVCYSLLVALLENKIGLEQSNLQLQAEKSDAQMAFLRSQLNPHFLFNTLSYLHSKTIKYDSELSDTILKLSDLLRYSLVNSQEEKVDIEKEVKLLENYITIFKNRFAGKCFVEFKVLGSDLKQKMEPLLLIPFVENTFKHGVLNDAETPAEILIDVKKGILHFYCRNKISHYQKDASSGIGVENVRQRLNLLYPEQYTLEIGKKEGYFIVDLTLQL